MIHLLCNDVLLLICEYLQPYQLLWLMRVCKRLTTVIIPVVNKRFEKLTLVMETGNIRILPLFGCDMKGKIMYYIGDSFADNQSFVQWLRYIVPLKCCGLEREIDRKWLYEIIGQPRYDYLIIILYHPESHNVFEHKIDYVCSGFNKCPVIQKYAKLYSEPLIGEIRQKYGDNIKLVYDVVGKRFYYLNFAWHNNI